MLTWSLKRSFSLVKKQFYDAIFIGPVATLVARQLHHQTNNRFTSLVINSQDRYLQPILIPIRAKPFKISDTIDRKMHNCDLRITKVLPNDSKIQYADGTQIGYRQLVFTQNNQPEYTCEGLKEALESPNSMVFSNKSSDISDLYQIQSGNIVFAVPKGRHVGYDNYLFLHLMDYANKRRLANPEKRIFFTMTVLNGSDRFFPYHQRAEDYLRNLMKQAEITVIDNVSPTKIDTETRKLHLSNKTTIDYAGFYQYLQLKEPKQLEGINSSDLNQETLKNNKYSNITIFGNAQPPTTHSYYALNYQVNAVRQNVRHSLLNDGLYSPYNGRSVFTLWKSHTQCVYFANQYDGEGKKDGVGQGNLAGKILGLDRKYGSTWEVETYYKFKHYGIPFYFKYPEAKWKRAAVSQEKVAGLFPQKRSQKNQ